VTASPQNPLRGGCGCGTVRFEIRAPFIAAWYCHCHRCQHRTGASCSPGARIGRGDFVAIRLGAIEGDPGIRPEYRQWVSSAAPWEPIPDDGLPRYEEAAP
jgi:hypothetical protein